MEKLLDNLRNYQDVCSTPFNTKAVRKFIRERIHDTKNLYENPYCMYYNTGTNNGKRKLLIMCHTDHPGITLKADKTGVFWGTPGYSRLKNLLSKSPIALRIFDNEGVYVGQGELVDIWDEMRQLVKIESEVPIKDNYSAQYDMEGYKNDGEYLWLYNADDGINVPILLELINQHNDREFDVYYIFNLHEEVFQLTAWHNASTNFFKLKPTDLVVNLECLRVENVKNGKYSQASYQNGPVIQISNIGCLFGYKNKGGNLSEKMLAYVAKNSNIGLQVGVINDSCDARPFTEFALTPNICSLTIPNEYKHNNNDGVITPEKIMVDDVNRVTRILSTLVSGDESLVEEANQSGPSLSYELKKNNDVTDMTLMKAKTRLNNRLEIVFKGVVNRGYFYPVTLIDKITDFILKLLSYPGYLKSTLSVNN